MTEEFLKALKELDFDSLTAREAVLVRQLLNEAIGKWDEWIAGIARAVNGPANPAKAAIPVVENGRPPELATPVKAPKRRGRPVPKLKVDLNVNRPRPARPEPLAVGGADAATDAPRPAQIFQESYVSKDGPRPGAVLPPDHPRNLERPSSVTPEVDMSDFHEVEEAMRKGQLGKVFQ